MKVLGVRCGDQVINRLERLAKSKGVLPSSMARDLICQALDRADTSQVIAALGLQMQALRADMAEQVEAMRSAFAAGNAQSVEQGRHLSEAIRQVSELGRQVAARDELVKLTAEMVRDTRYALDGLGYRLLKKESYDEWRAERKKYREERQEGAKK